MTNILGHVQLQDFGGEGLTVLQTLATHLREKLVLEFVLVGHVDCFVGSSREHISQQAFKQGSIVDSQLAQVHISQGLNQDNLLLLLEVTTNGGREDNSRGRVGRSGS